MDKIVVIGGGGHAKVIISIIKKSKKYNIIGYTDIKDNGEILGVKYLGNDDILEEIYLKKAAKFAVIGIGQIKNVETRKQITEKIKKIGFIFPSIISIDSIINEDVKIGKGSVVMDGVVINSGTEVGKYSIVNTKASIDHDCKIGNFVHIAPGVTVSGEVKIGDNTFIGTGSSVVNNITIKSNTFIKAHSLVK